MRRGLKKVEKEVYVSPLLLSQALIKHHQNICDKGQTHGLKV